MSTVVEPPSQPRVPGLNVSKRRQWSASLIWLVPLFAALLGLSVLVRTLAANGPQIQISFDSASGLETNKTQVRFKNVVIGAVSSIALAKDRSHVIVTVQLTNGAKAFATQDARFWVVRPHIDASGISGLDTIFSGSFIGADVGMSLKERTAFVGLENQPAVVQGEKGREFILHADEVGSLDVGTPVYYRRFQVGRIVSIKLNDVPNDVRISIFIRAPYDHMVTGSTRFWNASGLDFNLGTDGLRVNTQSLATVLAGGIAFEGLPDPPSTAPAAPDTLFALASDEKSAMAKPDGPSSYYVMRFDQSLRGLAVDAPIEFQGVNIGKVSSIDLNYDEKTQSFPTIVGALIYPRRLGRAYERLSPSGGPVSPRVRNQLMSAFVSKGLRAQARTASLLTGQLYISLDFVPGATKVTYDTEAVPATLPTVPSQFDKVQQQVADIVDKMDRLPLESIGHRVDGDLASLQQSLTQLNRDVLPVVRDSFASAKETIGAADITLKTADQTLSTVNGVLADDSSFRRDLSATLQELQRSSRSLRELSDYLDRHPESLIRGRASSEDKKPAAVAPSSSAKP